MNKKIKVEYRGGYSRAWDSPANAPAVFRKNPITLKTKLFAILYKEVAMPEDYEKIELVNSETGELIERAKDNCWGDNDDY
jgi:hypothetical protein